MPQTTFMHRVILAVPEAAQAAANQLAASIVPDPADALTFTVPLNASGQPGDPVTAYWCSAALRDADWAKVKAAVPQVPGGTYYRCDPASAVLLETNSVTAQGHVGEPWTPAGTLADLGLKTIAATIGG